MTKTISLTQGEVALVDDEDFEWLNHHTWACQKSRATCYAIREEYSDGKQTKVYMHRQILHSQRGQRTHHINGNGLDNRRANIVACTRSEHAKIHPRGLGRKTKPV